MINRLIQGGNNSEDAKKMVESNLDYVKRVYPDATIREMTDVIRTLGIREGSEKDQMKREKDAFDNTGEKRDDSGGLGGYRHYLTEHAKATKDEELAKYARTASIQQIKKRWEFDTEYRNKNK